MRGHLPGEEGVDVLTCCKGGVGWFVGTGQGLLHRLGAGGSGEVAAVQVRCSREGGWLYRPLKGGCIGWVGGGVGSCVGGGKGIGLPRLSGLMRGGPGGTLGSYMSSCAYCWSIDQSVSASASFHAVRGLHESRCFLTPAPFHDCVMCQGRVHSPHENYRNSVAANLAPLLIAPVCLQVALLMVVITATAMVVRVSLTHTSQQSACFAC